MGGWPGAAALSSQVPSMSTCSLWREAMPSQTYFHSTDPSSESSPKTAPLEVAATTTLRRPNWSRWRSPSCVACGAMTAVVDVKNCETKRTR